MGHGHWPEAAISRKAPRRRAALAAALLLAGFCLAGGGAAASPGGGAHRAYDARTAIPYRLVEDDQETARQAREAGAAAPFAQILERARREHPGELLGVEIERKHGRLVYELRILGAGGHIREWRYDALSAEPVAESYPRHDEPKEHR